MQISLLDKLLHRDLSNAAHQTNLHLHYVVPYAASESQVLQNGDCLRNESFFSLDPDTPFDPRDSTIHRPLSMRQGLEKKLRWITVGGQYDWTAKDYPSGQPPPFPQDIGRLLQNLFPSIQPQAAIVNFYSPGNTLSLHRDVSEKCDRGLISLSIGCDAVFIVGNDEGSQTVAMKLHSGDAVLMKEGSRFAWHAVPKVIKDTCPDWLQDWPATPVVSGLYENYRGWMRNRRINLNVRQMFD